MHRITIIIYNIEIATETEFLLLLFFFFRNFHIKHTRCGQCIKDYFKSLSKISRDKQIEELKIEKANRKMPLRTVLIYF